MYVLTWILLFVIWYYFSGKLINMQNSPGTAHSAHGIIWEKRGCSNDAHVMWRHVICWAEWARPWQVCTYSRRVLTNGIRSCLDVNSQPVHLRVKEFSQRFLVEGGNTERADFGDVALVAENLLATLAAVVIQGLVEAAHDHILAPLNYQTNPACKHC